MACATPWLQRLVIAALKKLWAKTCKAAGIVDLHFHDLRHEAGSRFLEAGWPLSEVQWM